MIGIWLIDPLSAHIPDGELPEKFNGHWPRTQPVVCHSPFGALSDGPTVSRHRELTVPMIAISARWSSPHGVAPQTIWNPKYGDTNPDQEPAPSSSVGDLLAAASPVHAAAPRAAAVVDVRRQ